MPTLSLLISIFSDRTEQFEMSLRSLTSHSYDARSIELLVFIDYTKNKPILNILKKYRKYFSSITTFIVTSKLSPVNHSATRRNFLATHAKGGYIIFSEPEMFHINNTIQCFLSHIHAHETQMWIGGPVYAAGDVANSKGELIDNAKPLKNFRHFLDIANSKNILENREFQKRYHLIDNTLYSTPFYCTMFKHNDFLKLKGLNQNLKVRGYEEMEFSERFLKSGGRIIIDDDIKTIHLSHPKSLDKTSQISWNLYNSTVSFNPAQKIGTITDATFREFPIL